MCYKAIVPANSARSFRSLTYYQTRKHRPTGRLLNCRTPLVFPGDQLRADNGADNGADNLDQPNRSLRLQLRPVRWIEHVKDQCSRRKPVEFLRGKSQAIFTGVGENKGIIGIDIG